MCSEIQEPTQMGSEQTCLRQTGSKQMAPEQIKLKELSSRQMGPAKINAWRNGFCAQYLKSHSSVLSQNKSVAVNRLNYRR